MASGLMHSIKRPLAVIGFTFFITGSLVLSMPKEYTVILLALFALFTFVHCKTRKKYTKHLALMLAVAAVAVGYINVYTALYQKSVDGISTETAVYTGYISKINNPDNTSYTVTLIDENLHESCKVSVYYGNYYDIGDVVSITGRFKPAKSDKYIFSNYSDNIKGSISAEDITKIDLNPKTVKYKCLTVKKLLLDSASQLYRNEILAVVAAMGYNDGHLISGTVKALFKTAGLSHALVVSGLHVGIVVLAVQKLLLYIPIDKKLKNIAAAATVIAFMNIIGLSPSVIRAGFLVAVVLLCRNLKLQQDSLTTLALIGLISILLNPYITRNIGAMLSYAASVGIVITNKWCEDRAITDNKKNFICACAAVVFTLPILALAGMPVTLMSPVYNLVFAVFVTIICVLSVVTPILNLIPIIKIANIALVAVNKFVITALLNALTLIYQYLDFATINLAHPVFLVVIAAATAAGFVAYFQASNPKHKNIFVISVSIIAFVCYNLLNYNIVAVTAFDSGREASFHISAKGKEYLVITEEITADEAKDLLVSFNETEYEKIFYCPKEFKNEIDLNSITGNFVKVDSSNVYTEDGFVLESSIEKNKKLFKISAGDCDISFGHGKVTSKGGAYYFLGNDKPKQITADEIYIFGNTPKWMEVEDVFNINSDITIKINLKTGKYKTVKDVFNFGYQL